MNLHSRPVFPPDGRPRLSWILAMWILAITVALDLSGTCWAQAQHGVPDRRIQRRELRELRAKHAGAYRDPSRDARSDLAGDLRDASRALEPAARFVYLEEARTLAVGAGEVKLALEIAESLAKAFVVDRFELLGRTAKDLARGVASREDLVEVGRRTLKLVTEAVEAENYEGGESVAAIVARIARKAGDEDRLQRAVHFRRQLVHLARLHEAMTTARRELLGEPEAPDLHLAVAVYHALARCDLESAIPHLARVADERLRRAAAGELEPPADPEAKISLARSWEELIDAEHPLSTDREQFPYRWHFLSRALRDRALHWYREALPGLSAVERLEIEAHIAGWGEREVSNLVGGTGGGGFDDTPPGSGLLVGLRYSIGHHGRRAVIGSVKPMFRTPHGEELGPRHRGRSRGAVDVIARPGYAVGGVRAAGTDRVEMIRLIFMRVNGPRLDPNDSYTSEVLGERSRAVEETIDWGGVPVIGIHGRDGDDVDALGLLFRR